MKRKITFVTSVFIIAMMLFTSNVFADETFTHEGSTYVIDEVKLKLDTLGENIDCWGMDENNNYIYFDYENPKFYKVTETDYAVMSSQEILNLMNNKYHTHNFIDINDLNIYQEKFPISGIQEEGYTITEDKIIDSNKVYYKKVEDQNSTNVRYEIANNPDLENGTYYEKIFCITPKSAKIDENISYYLYEMHEKEFIKVENPIEEEVYNYAVIGEAEKIEPTKIGKMTQETYDKIFLSENLSYLICYDEEDIYVLINYMDSKKSIIYKADGTIVAEYDALMLMEMLGNKFFIITKTNDQWELIDNKISIIDKGGNTVHESTNLPFFETIDYGKYTTYLKHYEFDVNKFYNMYEYELLSEDNQKYEGKDLTIKASGELNRLKSVKVNNVELEASNYTKTSGSTIITLKNDYLKTLELGTYTLALGYTDGTTIETKFIVDKIFSNDTENEDADNVGDEGNSGETGGASEGEAIEEDKNKGEKDETPPTGNVERENTIALYITAITAIVALIVTRKK